MSAKKPKKHTNSPRKYHLPHSLRIIFSDPRYTVVLLAVLIAAILAGRYTLDALATKNMESENYDISIVAFQTLSPSKELSVKYCNYSSFKFEKATLTCTIEKFGLFDVQNREEALNISNKIGSNLRREYSVTKYLDDSSISKSLESYAIEHTSNCSVSTRYYPEATREFGIPSFPRGMEAKGLLVYSSCSRGVLREYYPVL